MSFLTPAKKSLVAVALVAPLALTACNSDGEDTVSDASSAVKTMTTTKASEETSAPSESKDKKDEDKDKSEENKDDEDLKKLVEVWHSKDVQDALNEQSKGTSVQVQMGPEELAKVLKDTEDQIKK